MDAHEKEEHVGNTKSSDGPTGATGATGVTGVTGVTGATGPQGMRVTSERGGVPREAQEPQGRLWIAAQVVVGAPISVLMKTSDRQAALDAAAGNASGVVFGALSEGGNVTEPAPADPEAGPQSVLTAQPDQVETL